MSERNFLDVPEDSDAPYESLFLQADEEFRQFVKTLADDPHAGKLKSKSIKPAPGFCVKLKDTSTGGKLFINVCHTPELPEPQDISDEELIHILGSDDPTTYRVPLSLGLPHEEVDKSGGPCTVYDVIINETFFRKISSNELFKTFLITVALDGIEEKYNAHPDRENYVVLKNKLYMGTMPDHCIQDRKGPLISELPTLQSLWLATTRSAWSCFLGLRRRMGSTSLQSESELGSDQPNVPLDWQSVALQFESL